jgi:hypothetical protein
MTWGVVSPIAEVLEGGACEGKRATADEIRELHSAGCIASLAERMSLLEQLILNDGEVSDLSPLSQCRALRRIEIDRVAVRTLEHRTY